MCAKVFLQLQIVAIIILAAVCNVSCVSDMHWTRAGECLVWSSGQDSLEWKGNLFEGVAHGSGKIVTVNEKGTQNAKDVSAFYGALNPDDIVEVDNGGKFVGKTDDNKMVGFGVLVQGKELFIGDFENSKPNGYLKWYKNDSLYYDGHWQAGAFHGEGTLYKEDGSIKSGEWSNGNLVQTFVTKQMPSGLYVGYVRNGKPDGLGKMKYKNGSLYQGKWKNGQWHGEGLYTNKEDSIYGIWSKGKLNGDAVYSSRFFVYEGTCLDNAPYGEGILTTSDESRYTGYWVDGKRCGMGDMLFSNGDFYSGEWENNAFDGYGEYDYKLSEAHYKGYWKEGLQDGKGEYRCSDFIYQGEWEKGWMDGNGFLVFKNKDRYEGTVHENLIDGVGCYMYANGNRYEGEFVQGTISGLGVFQFKNGSRFEGEFYNGRIYGDGTMYLVEGKDTVAITGFWPIDGSFPHEASILFANGDLYEGPIVNGMPTADGTWVSGKERKAKIEAVEKSSLHKANEFYKKHRETINWCLMGASAAVTAVELCTAGSVIALPVAAVCQGINMGINVADASMAIASAAIDVKENRDLGEDDSESLKNLGLEVGMNAAFVVVPKAVKAAAKPLGKGVKNVCRSSFAKAVIGSSGRFLAKKSAIKFAKGKILGKLTRISVSVQSGVRKVEKALYRCKYTQNVATATGRLLTREKHQFVKYSKYLDKIKSNPELKNKLKMSEGGNPSNLGANMRLLGTEKWFRKNERHLKKYSGLAKNQVEAHHVIPSNPKTDEGKAARAIWMKYFGSPDHPCNGIWLGRSSPQNGYKALAKGTNHVSNSFKYERIVGKAIIDVEKRYGKQYANNPDMMQKLIAETVDNIKKKLYKGELAIGTSRHEVHTVLSIFKESKKTAAEASRNIINAIGHLAIQ